MVNSTLFSDESRPLKQVNNSNKSTRFSEDNQPLKRGKTKGKKHGSKLLSDYIFNYQDYTRIPPDKMSTYLGDMLWTTARTLEKIKFDEDAPNVLRTVAEGLSGNKKMQYSLQIIDMVFRHNKEEKDNQMQADMDNNFPIIDIEKIIHPTFKELIIAALRQDITIFNYGGYGSGKTFVCALIMLYRALHNADEHIICLRKNYSDTRESQVNAILKCADILKVQHLIEVQKSHPVTIKVKHNNSKITTTGTSDVQNFKSRTDITAIWIEEATQIDYDDWLIIQSQIRVEKGLPLLKILSFNPIDEEHWINQRYFKPNNISPQINEFITWESGIQEDEEDDVKQKFAALKTNYKVNEKHLNKKTIKYYESLKVLSPRQYQIGVDGDWGTLSEEGIFKYEKILFGATASSGSGNVIYADVNLAPKGKGDYTAVVKIVADISTQTYSIVDYRCFNCTDLFYARLCKHPLRCMTILFTKYYFIF
jgi:hypothetical protein